MAKQVCSKPDDTTCSNLPGGRNVCATPSRDTIPVYTSCLGTERNPTPLVQHPDVRRQTRTPAWPGVRSDQGPVRCQRRAEAGNAKDPYRPKTSWTATSTQRGTTVLSRNATEWRHRLSEARCVTQPTTAETWEDDYPAAVQPTAAEMSSRYIWRPFSASDEPFLAPIPTAPRMQIAPQFAVEAGRSRKLSEVMARTGRDTVEAQILQTFRTLRIRIVQNSLAARQVGAMPVERICPGRWVRIHRHRPGTARIPPAVHTALTTPEWSCRPSRSDARYDRCHPQSGYRIRLWRMLRAAYESPGPESASGAETESACRPDCRSGR